MVPYVLAYDLAIPLAALVWHLRDDRPRLEPGGLALVVALWALPFALTIMLQVRGIPLLAVTLLAAYFWLVAGVLGWRSLEHLRSAWAATRA
jgi:hypothetical protein